MRIWAVGLCGLALLGCQTETPAYLRQRPSTDEYVLPPAEARFTQPQVYPRDTLNQPPVKKNYGGPGGGGGGAPRMGGGLGGGGGPGGGGPM